jgi:hypothetical protein
MSMLNDVQLSRWTGYGLDTISCEIHRFADASSVAYAAVIYFKVVSRSGRVTISLLAGKSKVAPVKPMSIPRLELSAAVSLAKLIEFIRKSINVNATSCYCWTDSTVVLAWLNQHPSKWKTFVANRVTDIQSRLPNISWYHVPTNENPVLLEAYSGKS